MEFIWMNIFTAIGVLVLFGLITAIAITYRKNPSAFKVSKINTFTLLAGLLVVCVAIGLMTDLVFFDWLTYLVFRWQDDDGDNALMMALGIFPFFAVLLSGLGLRLDKKSSISRIVFVVSCVLLIPAIFGFLASIPYLFI